MTLGAPGLLTAVHQGLKLVFAFLADVLKYGHGHSRFLRTRPLSGLFKIKWWEIRKLPRAFRDSKRDGA